MKVDNAIILAAGTSSRFAPLSLEKPKALVEACHAAQGMFAVTLRRR